MSRQKLYIKRGCPVELLLVNKDNGGFNNGENQRTNTDNQVESTA